MHIPPGKNVDDGRDFWFEKEQRIFLGIVKEYKSNIIGLLASHTHKEELKRIQGQLKKQSIAMIYTPALCTAHGNSPAFKTFYFEHSVQNNWQLSNYKVFHFFKQGLKPMIEPLYEYRAYYCKGREHRFDRCLQQITALKMKKYFTAGNPNFTDHIKSEEAIFLSLNN